MTTITNTTNKAYTLVIALVITISIALIFLSFRQASQAKSTAGMISHTQEVLFKTASLLSTITDNETVSRGYVLTGQPEYLELLEKSKQSVGEEFSGLKELVEDNGAQLSRIDSLRDYIEKKIAFSDSTVMSRKRSGIQAASVMVSDGLGKRYMEEIRTLLMEMQNEETRLLEQRKTANEIATAWLDRIIGTIILIILVLIVVLLRKGRLDISERKKNIEQVEFLSRQINQSNDAIYTVDASLKIKSWNKGAETLYGFSLEEVLNKDPNKLLNTRMTNDELNVALDIIANKDYWSGELQRQTKAGDFIFVHSSTSTIRDGSGAISGYVAVSFDISDQKKLRQQVDYLASTVEQSSEAIFSRGLNRTFISWNKGAEKLFGYTRQEAIGKTAAQLGLTRLTETEIKSLEKQLAETGTWTAEMTYYHKDGSTFFGAVTGSSITNEKGEATSLNFIVKDISLRKRLEDQLKKSNEELEIKIEERTKEIYKNEKRFRALIENNNDVITLRDKSFKIMYRSPSAYRITGWRDDEIEMVDNPSNFHPDDNEKVNKMAADLMQHPGEPIYTLFRTKHKNGHYLWMEGVCINLLHDENVNAYVFNFRDVTERILAEEKLIASEEQFRHSLDNMLEGVQIIDFDWKYIYVNEAMARHGKYKREEFPGHTVMEKYPGIEETEIFKIYQRCFNNREAIHLENEFVFPDKSVAWFELSFQPVPEGIFILSVDITDRKKAQEELIKSESLYRNLFEHMLHGFAYCKGIFDNGKLIDYEYLSVNEEYELLTGLNNITGKKISEAMPGLLDSDPNYTTIVERVALSGKPEKFETHVAPMDKWLSISLYSPEKGYFVGLIDNITERKKAEQKIKKLNTELEERVKIRTEQLKKSNEELETFSYSVSHDLRAPLRAIIGFTEILEADYSSKLDPEAQRITAIIKKNTLKMGQLIDDLLTFSRMGRQDILKTNIDTNDLVNDIISNLDKQQYAHKIEWNICTLPGAKADVNTIRQVWINLISNAVKYSSSNDQPKIEIGSMPSNGETIFYVKDNGVGFDEKYKNKLFRVFQRLHSADEFEGTGIGLAIVEKIVTKHGGKVWAEAQLNKGAEFYFSLPQN